MLSAGRVLSCVLCLATLAFPQATESQTTITVESLKVSTLSRTADVTLGLQSKDLDWKAVGNGKSAARVILITTTLDKKGGVLAYEREYRTITADTAKLPVAVSQLSIKAKIPAKTSKVRFQVQSAEERQISVFEVDRKTLYAASTSDVPLDPPCNAPGLCLP
jgi:hypothetical protein